MPQIRFLKSSQILTVTDGAFLMKSLVEAGIPVASSCGGDGICGKCRIQIIEGTQNLSEPNSTETFLKEKLGIAKDHRISCQTQVWGDIKIDTSYW